MVGGLPKADGTRIGPLRNLSALPTNEGAAAVRLYLWKELHLWEDRTLEVSPKVPSVDASAPLVRVALPEEVIEIRPIFFRFENTFKKDIEMRRV